jgi:oligopeptide transport system substrate-binding protein
MTRTRWKTLLGVVAALALVAFAACGDDDDDAPAGGGTTPGATTSAGDAKQGGEITIQYLEFQSFDPHFSSFSQDIGHQTFVWRGLFKLDKDNNAVPEMAAGMPQISADGKTYTIKLKPGLKWSDGQPLTAKDFAAGAVRTCDPDNAGEYFSLLANVVGCEAYYNANGDEKKGVAAKTPAEKEALRNAVGAKALDDTTVEYKLNERQPTFTMTLSLWLAWPVPTHIVKTPGEKWPEPTSLAFNGPFKVESYTPKQGMVLVRNDNYAGEHKAYLDKITFRYIDDNSQSNNAFRSKELDVALADTANLKVLQSEFKNELFSYAKANTIGLEMQLEKPPLNNEKVRLALSRAIDRKTLAENVLQGSVAPTTTWIPADVVKIKADEFDSKVGFNPDEAKKLLADAGFANGSGLPKMNFLIRDTPSNKAMAQFLQQEFKKHLNIDIEIEVVDAPTRSKRFNDEQFELFPGGWNQDYPDPENWLIGLFDAAGTFNHYNCTDPEIDGLIKKAQFNPNNEERLKQYQDANKLIVERACGIAPIYHEARHVLTATNLGGMREFATSQDRVLAGDWAPEEWFVKN